MARAGRFFDTGDVIERPAEAAPFTAPRPFQASATVLDLSKKKETLVRSAEAWQTAAWNYFDAIGELKFAFNLVANVASRALLFPAIIGEPGTVPTPTDRYLNQFTEEHLAPEELMQACDIANEIMSELENHAELIRAAWLNFSVAGEGYLVNTPKWQIASVDEIMPGTRPRRKRFRNRGGAIDLPPNTYIARIWRPHPRFSAEPDSSLLGVLDQCEKLVLFDQVVRAVARSRLGAGIVYIPSGLVPASGRSIEDALVDITTAPVTDEAAAGTVSPLFLTGPVDSAKALQRIDLGRDLDPELVADAQRSLDRLLAGIDIPKELVSGMENVKFANAIAVDDNLYKAHIEPGLMIISDAFTDAYLIPKMRRAGVSEALLKRFCIWYNPSEIVTRPDQSTSANEGYDRFLISNATWRRVRGYTEEDAPEPEELVRRLALEKTQIPPDMAAALIKAIDPEFFTKLQGAAQESAGVPSDIQSLLQGVSQERPGPLPGGKLGEPDQAPTGQGGETVTRTAEASGGELSPDGSGVPSVR